LNEVEVELFPEIEIQELDLDLQEIEVEVLEFELISNDETEQYEADSQSREYAFPSGGDPDRQKETLLSFQGIPPQERKQL
jgi:hypothetical protein